MTATDRLRFVLVRTSHPGNIGAAARAIRTMGFVRLVLVAPQQFPHAEATALAAGADDVLGRIVVVPTLVEAIADCRLVLGATARQRGVPLPEHVPRAAAPLALAAAEAWRQHRHAATDDARVAHELIAAIRAAAADVPDVEVVGDPDARLPHVVTFSCLYVDGEALVGELDRRGFAVASGSACTADTLQPSHVLAAIGALTHGNVRVTLPLAAVAPTRERDVARFCAELPQAVAAVRAHLGTLDL